MPIYLQAAMQTAIFVLCFLGSFFMFKYISRWLLKRLSADQLLNFLRILIIILAIILIYMTTYGLLSVRQQLP